MYYGEFESAQSAGSLAIRRFPTATSATLESVKAASDVYCPLDGEIVEVNEAIVNDPSIVNSDAQGAGWFFRLKLANAADAEGLMDEAAYKAMVE